jgi:putative FmdB family regulatory protein
MRDRQGGLGMPVYEFLCQQCGKSFELALSIADAERKRKEGVQCSGCGSWNVVQQLSHFQVKTSKKS